MLAESNNLSAPHSEHAATNPYLADLYTFDWTAATFHAALITSIAVAIALVGGVLIGHPAAGLIMGAGAMQIGFGLNQRIADSRLAPMIAATFVMAISTFVGMLAGHTGYGLVIAATVWAFVYGLLTARAAGIAWVGQQAAVTLLVTSAFPASAFQSLQRAGLTLAGGALQIILTSLFLRILPELKENLLAFKSVGQEGIAQISHHMDRRRVLRRLRGLPKALPHLSNSAAVTFAVRMAITVALASELYHRLGVQSGYWIPMTALLVQKPAFYETFARAALRIAGTLAGAVVTSFFLVHIHPDPLVLAVLATLFAFCALATNAVNYGLFTLFLTSYIVFLLSLNQMPGSVIAHRRAYATIAGGLIALLIHLDALRRHRKNPTTT